MNAITVVMIPRKRNEKQFKNVLINVEKFLPFEINFDGAECWLSRKIFVLNNFLFWYLKGVDGWGADWCKSKWIREEVFCKHTTGQEIVWTYWNRKPKRINRNSTKKVNTLLIWNRFLNMQICWRKIIVLIKRLIFRKCGSKICCFGIDDHYDGRYQVSAFRANE